MFFSNLPVERFICATRVACIKRELRMDGIPCLFSLHPPLPRWPCSFLQCLDLPGASLLLQALFTNCFCFLKQQTILDTLSSADLFFAQNPAPPLAHASWDSRALSDSWVKRTSLPLTILHSVSSLISSRYYYYYYIDEHVEIWSKLAPWEITMTACFTLVYMYMKFLCIWRTFRCWSLLDGLRPSPPLLPGCSLGWLRLILLLYSGVDCIDSMSACVYNVASFADFWR